MKRAPTNLASTLNSEVTDSSEWMRLIASLSSEATLRVVTFSPNACGTESVVKSSMMDESAMRWRPLSPSTAWLTPA